MPRGSAKRRAAPPAAGARTVAATPARRVRSRPPPRRSLRFLARQREVDVLERRPPHLEPVELLAARQRLGRELVQQARRLARLHEHLLAVAPVADLDGELRRRQLARRSLPDDSSLA